MDDTTEQGDSIEEVRFGISDPKYPFVDVSEAEGCRVALERLVHRGDDRYAEFFAIDGARPDRVLDHLAEHDRVDPSVLGRREDGGLFEFAVSSGCPVQDLAANGAVPRAVESTDGDGRIVAEILPGNEATELVASFLEDHPSAELISKREKDHSIPLFTERELQRAMDERLTERQRSVLRTAYEAGYYERPRETTGEELAAELGISSATFSQHVRAAERNLLSILYDDEF